jgi:hypothetical protein
MVVTTALEAAEALMAALGIAFGEVVVQVSDGQLVLIRSNHVLKSVALSEMKTPAA